MTELPCEIGLMEEVNRIGEIFEERVRNYDVNTVVVIYPHVHTSRDKQPHTTQTHTNLHTYMPTYIQTHIHTCLPDCDLEYTWSLAV